MSKTYTISEIKEIINKNMEYLSEKYFVNRFLLFGSYAKNEQTEESDIDLLAEFRQTIGMFDFVELQEYLSNILNKKIDLGTISGLKPYIKDEILKDAITL